MGMGMDDIDFVSAGTDQESCSVTHLDIEKEIDDSDIIYLIASPKFNLCIHNKYNVQQILMMMASAM